MGDAKNRGVSIKNRYYLDQNRMRELRYFCLQYPHWVSEYESLIYLSSPSVSNNDNNQINSITEMCAIKKAYYSERILLVENAVRSTSVELYEYILKCVTEGLSYDDMYSIPCGRRQYYEYYRKFFWLLDKARK